MFIIFAYLVFLLRPIYLVTTDSVKSNGYLYFENMASKYIPVILPIIIILVMAIGISIYFLMRKKEKPVLFYKIVIIYSIVLLITVIYYYFFFKSLSNTTYSPLRMVINRDISLLLYLANFFFVGFSFIRAFGFDIKKFSFDKDRKELMLEEADSEEYEVNINVEKDDILNYFNRQKRELKYYFQENSRFFIIILVIAFLSFGSYFLFNHFVVNKVYEQNENITIGNISYTILKSVTTNIDKYGKVSNNDFLVVYLNIKNSGKKVTLNDQQFRISINDEYYYPSTSYCDYFDDLGECYHDPEIASNINKEYIMVYKINKEYQDIYFEILKGKSTTYLYTKVKLSHKKLDRDIIDYNMEDNFEIGGNTHQILSFKILNKTSFIYEECKNNKCNKYTKLVNPKLGYQVLVLEINDLEKLDDAFLENYIGLKYRNNTLYGSDINVIDRYQKYVYLEIPNLVHQEDRLVLTINTRSTEYDILLKGGVNE